MTETHTTEPAAEVVNPTAADLAAAHSAPIGDWKAAGEAMKAIANAHRRVEGAKAIAQVKVNAINEGLDEDIRDDVALIAAKGAALKVFADANRGDFGKRKSMKLGPGQIAYKDSTSVELTDKVEEVLQRLAAADMYDAIQTKEMVRLEALETYPLKRLKEIGATRKQTTTFSVKLNQDGNRKTVAVHKESTTVEVEAPTAGAKAAEADDGDEEAES